MWTICSWLPLTEFQRLRLSSKGLEKRSNARGLKCGTSKLAALLLSGACSYVDYYTLHFVFIRAAQTQWMLCGLVLLGLYVLYTVAVAINWLILIVPAALSLVRGGANAVLFYHACLLYSRAVGGRTPTVLL